MSDIGRQLDEDRALRNSARDVFSKELAHVRREATPTAIGQRFADRIGARAEAASDAAVEFTESHGRTVITVVAAAVSGAVLWFAHGPIKDGISRLLVTREEEDAGDVRGDDQTEETDDE